MVRLMVFIYILCCNIIICIIAICKVLCLTCTYFVHIYTHQEIAFGLYGPICVFSFEDVFVGTEVVDIYESV